MYCYMFILNKLLYLYIEAFVVLYLSKSATYFMIHSRQLSIQLY